MSSSLSFARLRSVVFFGSGFAGLIYESIWTHYLKLFLGHAAYAQTLVLAIFMGGMAIGAAVAGRFSTRIAAPLRAYAAIEAAIGAAALGFHAVFAASTDAFYDHALARQLEGTSLVALKWALATALILPQSILLGATFPVFAAAATRDAPASTGRSLATLYFANSLGGALGVLMSGFVLVPRIGLPATMACAGAMNLAIAAAALALAGRAAPSVPPLATQHAGTTALGRIERLLLAVALLTGASSFVYEVAWIRMLSLALGSATHSFELMLSAFILGLALGGAWIRKRIDTAASPGRLLGQIQIVMGFAALATVPLYGASFDLVAWVVRMAPKTDAGYAAFNLVRYGVSAVIMFPAAFCAGTTLPLVTRILYARPAQGERAIGFVYGANTVGAIVGVLFAVHLGLPLLGLDYLLASGAIVDIALGVVLLAAFGGAARRRVAGAALAGSLAASAAVAATFDPQRLASGVYRSGKAATEGRVLAIAHGKTATISVDRNGATVSLRTNGKPDASAMPGSSHAHALDEVTMTLTGTLPLMLHPAPARVANIGFGAGLTGALLLGDPRVQQVDTIEIEPQVVAQARHFAPLNDNLYTDPRSQVHIDDAKSFFAVRGQRYDLIVSEPSNPWVSGVAGLFSVEFYRHAARYLADGGLFAQWLQIYEMHPERVTSVLKAVDQSFADWLVIAVDQSDLLIVAAPRGSVSLPADAFARLSDEVRARLRRLTIARPEDITLRVIGNRRLLAPWLVSQPQVPANSDFAPYLDAHADRDRFIGDGFGELIGLAFSPYPIAEMLGARPPLPDPALPSINQHFGVEPPALAARLVSEALLGPLDGAVSDALPLPAGLPAALAAQGERLIAECREPPLNDRAYAAAGFAIRVLPHLPPAQGRRLLDALAGARCLDADAGPWPALLRAVAARDAATFGPLADEMLAAGHGGTEVRARYLLGLALLGHLARADQPSARTSWQRHAERVLRGGSPGVALEVLRQLAYAGRVGGG